MAVEDSMLSGYAPELRGDAGRYQTFRARWLGNDPASYATIYRMLASTEMESELKNLSCPVRVIGGALDRVRPPAMAKATASLIPGSNYIELPTGHYMAAQTPELIANAINDFLISVDA
jgi:3-oxoadipate enol-lactonase